MRKFLSLLLGSIFVVSSALASQPVQKDWTLLVYLNGDNNLDSYGAVNIQQMEQVGSTDNLNIVVQWASESAGTTKRLLVQNEPKDTDGTTVSSPIVADIGKTDMGDVKSLEAFIDWGVQNYPAKHFMIDVWDHGAGWHSIQAMDVNSGKHSFHPTDISWDDNSGNYITTEQLGQAMGHAAQVIGHKVDVYGSDACLMAMAEVANEMSDSVQYFAGSQETEPGAGWPYGDWLKQWANTPNTDAAIVAKTLVNAYVKSYEAGGSNAAQQTSEVTFSAYDLTKLADLDNAIADLGKQIRAMNAADKGKLFDTAKTVQSFTDPDYGDLLDFMSLISASGARSVQPQVISEVQAAAQALIINNADTPQYAKAKGLSIWLPTDQSTYSANSARYKGLKFSIASDWGATLDFLLQGASCRM